MRDWRLVRTKRLLGIEHEAAKLSGHTTTYDPKRPWDSVIKAITTNRGWWHDELEETALMLLGRTHTLSQFG